MAEERKHGSQPGWLPNDELTQEWLRYIREYRKSKEDPEPVWQMIGEDSWVFGVMVRGLVRKPLGEFYFDEDCKSPIGGWIWFTLAGEDSKRGVAATRWDAAWFVEEALGIVKVGEEEETAGEPNG